MEKNYYFIFYCVLAVILLYGMKVKKRGEWHEDALSLPVSKKLLGFSAVGIMLHHMSQTLNNRGDVGILLFMVDIGVCFVGLYFFFSGYGLYSSLRNKPDYLKSFFRRRMPSILIPFYLCNFTFIACAALNGQKFERAELISYLTGWVLLNSQMWYVVEMFFLYLLFYLVFRWIKKDGIACLVYGILTAALIVGSLFLGHDRTTVSGGAWFKGEWWYNATFMIWIGILFAKFEKKLLLFIRKYYLVLLPVFALAVCCFYRLTLTALRTKGYWYEWDGHPGYQEKFQTLAVQLPFIFCFMIFTVLLMQKVQFGNKILYFLGEISLELYLSHNVFITFLPIKNTFLYICEVYAASLVLALILHTIDRYLIGLFRTKQS